jgi:two-component system NtrC family sensor kinase
MKLLLSLFFIVFLLNDSFAQDTAFARFKTKVEKALINVEMEKDPVKRHDIMMEINNSGIDDQPLYMLEVGKKVLDISARLKDPVTESCGWSFYGQAYRLTGNFIKALECHLKAVEIAGHIENKSVIGYALSQMGHIYKDREENEKAIQIYHEAIANAELGQNKLAKIQPLMNLGVVYLNENKLDSALYYSKKTYEYLLSLSLVEEFTELRLISFTLSTIGGAYSKMGNKDDALKYYWQALTMLNKFKILDIRYKILVYVNIAEHYERYKQKDSTLFYAHRALQTIDHSSFLYLAARPARMISKIYEKTNSDSALKYTKLYLQSDEVLNSARVTQQLQMIAVEDAQRREEIEREEEAYRNKVKIYVLTISFIILGLFALFMYRSNKQRLIANKQLVIQKEELEETLLELQNTQKQLIQSEKMASLGELTAGIAHEIQNPLNFVNNFSELNGELLAEMKEEMEKGNMDDVKAIADDVIENQKKINHHGKRADGIVKGMLQHSRTSTGLKEPADINLLADEYLRLAYHGLRAKDKSFNATMNTDFDDSIGMIKVVAQDIGRVVLNIITNAFHATSERKKQEGEGYHPAVSVGTKKYNDRVEISIKDNGKGIPQNIVDKIFQPFFTTKPTGQGTGLGLSLGYDIVKSHGGEIVVETKEGEGTLFIIRLPI